MPSQCLGLQLPVVKTPGKHQLEESCSEGPCHESPVKEQNKFGLRACVQVLSLAMDPNGRFEELIYLHCHKKRETSSPEAEWVIWWAPVLEKTSPSMLFGQLPLTHPWGTRRTWLPLKTGETCSMKIILEKWIALPRNESSWGIGCCTPNAVVWVAWTQPCSDGGILQVRVGNCLPSTKKRPHLFLPCRVSKVMAAGGWGLHRDKRHSGRHAATKEESHS